ncbi:unnamed protein product [Caenorhabditis sp. 36 PRJEB53466]|nr:unnamed protein product [Caenorhabditis sp. 36 PRJEB53466]
MGDAGDEGKRMIHAFFEHSIRTPCVPRSSTAETSHSEEMGSSGVAHTERFAVSRSKSSRKCNITVAMVVGDVATAERDYGTALNSMRCYCRMQNYKFELVEDWDYQNVCRQRDFMFRRHCIVAHLLRDTDWLVFLDADVAVVNPKVRIEEYIDLNYDLTFYDRFVNWEVAAGSYIVRNTPWARDFLLKFANFEEHLPDSFHGTDNGALHVFLQQTFYPQLSDEAHVCLSVWERADSFQDLFTFEACIRTVMGDVHEFDKARILKKGTGWVRDIWLADSKWSPDRDFMLHGLKDENQIGFGQGLIVNIIFGRFNWRSPFVERLELNECSAGSNWKWDNVYDKKLIVSREEVEHHLKRVFAEVERRRWKSLAAVASYI